MHLFVPTPIKLLNFILIPLNLEGIQCEFMINAESLSYNLYS